MLKHLYSDFILHYPKLVLLLLLLAVGYLGINSFKLEIDASSETLLLKNDKDLKFTHLINKRYKTPDFLVVTYTPQSDMLSAKSLDTIENLSSKLLQLDHVVSITSILNVPLLQSPPKPIKELLENIPTLQSKNIDFTLARNELLNSPIYRENLVSKDFKTTALIVNLQSDNTNISSDELRAIEHKTIKDIRAILDTFRNGDVLFLGGVSMIADDMISFVKEDLKIYGISVLLLLIVLLWIIFRELRWIFIPVIISTLSIISTAGILGLFGWKVTVISSNFISLQLIITMSIIIHLVVRYRELTTLKPDANQHELVLETMLSKLKPSFFAIITTIAGFSSLVFSGILPVINLGLMMSAGISISLFLTFLLFPTLVILTDKKEPYTFFEQHYSLTKIFADITKNYGQSIIFITLIITIFTISGASKLLVENSFIDYFKKSTEIYQGMAVIDQKLGGTTPLDIIVDFPIEEKVDSNEEIDEFDEFDEFEEEFEASKNDAQYWFTSEKMEQIQRIHTYLDSISEVGKVLSLGTMLELGRTLNDGEDLDNFQLALLYNELPKEFRSIILDPYVDVKENQVRFALRIIDSNRELRRDKLLKDIKSHLIKDIGLKEDNVHLSNLMVLYNNMLQSLFSSQIMTLGAMMLILGLMFLLLFKSFKLMLIALVVNIIPIGVIFGFMGWFKIPLDMMTITIAAISMGIAVDNTIHYIHRFSIEFEKDHNYIASMQRSHESIGYAMYYTATIIMIGFLVLVLSPFIPTIYFGLLTVLAMFMALIADLILLPQLILLIKPFKQNFVKEKI